MRTTTQAEPRCPECGGTFTIDTTATKEVPFVSGFHVRDRRLEVKEVPVIVAFCNQCEFSIEVTV